MSEIDMEKAVTANDGRLPYETPELIDCGDVAKVTQSGVNTIPTTDAAYS